MAVFGSQALPTWVERLAQFCHRVSPVGWRRRLLFLLRKPVLWRSGEVVDLAVLGAKFRLYPKTNLSDKRLLCTPGMLDGEERRFFSGTLAHEAWVIDVGANIGGYALLLAAQRPDLRVHCVEPDPDLAERLLCNIDFSGMTDRVTVSEVALSSESGEVTLYRDALNRGQNSVLQASAEVPDGAVTVPAWTLLQLLDHSGARGEVMLKMDIEGFEYPVLSAFFAGADRNRWPRWVQLEQYRKQSLNQAVELLLQQGYAIRRRTRMNVILELAQDHA